MDAEFYQKLPAYVKIKRYILDKIKDGTYVPHGRLPSEDEFCSMFSVARGTVRQALNELSNEGVIYRVHGKGTFVKPPEYEHEVSTGHFLSFWDELTQKGVQFSTELLGIERCYPDKKICGHLKIDPQMEQYFSIRRLRKFGDKIVMYAQNRVPCNCCPNLDQHKDALESIYDTMSDLYGVEIDMGQRLFHSIGATEALASLFEVPVGYPVISVEQLAYDKNGRCVDYANLWLQSENFHFSVTMKRRKHGGSYSEK